MVSDLSKNHSLETFRKFLKIFLHEEKQDLSILVLYGVCVSVCSLVIPMAVQAFVNMLGFGLLLQPILILTLIVFTVLVFSGTMTALQTYATELLQQRFFAKIAMSLAQRIPRVEYGYFTGNNDTYELNYFLEIATLQKTATVLILDASSVVLRIFFGIILLAFYHPFLLGLNFLILLFISIFFFGLANRAIKTSIEESKAKYSVAAWLHEMAENPISFRTTESREYAAQRTDELTTQYILKRRGHFRILFHQILSAIALQVIISSLLLGVGGWLVVRGQLTLGQLVASELILSSVVLGVGKFGKYLESYYDLAAALDKIGYLLELPVERASGNDIKNESEIGSFLKVTGLSVKGNLGNNIEALNFEMNFRQNLAIVGSTDEVRSELMKSLYGLKNNYNGLIEIDKIDVIYQSLEKIRSKIAYIEKVDLMSGTILDNIQLGNKELSFLEIKKTLDGLFISESISRLENGLNTQVNDLKINELLKRKILIARTILSKPKLIIFNEIFDHFDFGSDLSIKSLFVEGKYPFSVMVQARSRETVSFCDRIIDLDAAKVTEGM